jgi:hypothetical protein
MPRSRVRTVCAQIARRDNLELFDWARVFWWLILTVIAYFIGWLDKVAFVSVLSILALVESAWAARQASALNAKLAAIEEKLDLLLGSRLD